jgi:hypothetical protein
MVAVVFECPLDRQSQNEKGKKRKKRKPKKKAFGH